MHYVIVRNVAQYPAVADTYTVVYGDDNEALSHHETEASARQAINGYKRHDRHRARLARKAVLWAAATR